MKLTRRLRITGRVQGVGYREAMCDAALRLGVAGWVRNRGDGSVEAAVHGDPQALEAFIAWARRGSRAARVSGVEVSDDPSDYPWEYPGFVRRPTD
jgi:acylphosphatase